MTLLNFIRSTTKAAESLSLAVSTPPLDGEEASLQLVDKMFARLILLLCHALEELALDVETHQGEATLAENLNPHHFHGLEF